MYLAAKEGRFHHLSSLHALTQTPLEILLRELEEEEARANPGNGLDANRKIITPALE